MEIVDKMSAIEEEAWQFGLKWPSTDHIIEQVQHEWDKIKEQLEQDPIKVNQAILQEELGDLLHAVFSLCFFYKLSPRVILGQSLTKFSRRLRAIKWVAEEQGLLNLEGLSFEELMPIWKQAKELVG